MTALFSPADNFGVNELLPEMGGFLGDIRFYLCLFLLLVPILMGAMGALRFFRPTECPGCGRGYRALFGKGSAYAWQATQWLSGILFMGIGAVLLILAIIVCFVLGGKNVADAVSSVYTWLIVEGALLLLAILTVEVLIGLQFDRRGNMRPGRNFFFLEFVSYRQPKEEEEVEPEVLPEEEVVEEAPPISNQELFTQENFFDFDALLDDNSVPTENPKNKE